MKTKTVFHSYAIFEIQVVSWNHILRFSIELTKKYNIKKNSNVLMKIIIFYLIIAIIISVYFQWAFVFKRKN